ncbi:cytochrome P450 [Streptomyces sp. RerS4]|uniref:cytochrome P450 family protein n=1 Tax=Streptomyces sp. RerS4 TaxID=2942449 RepID=UPI00201BB79F|nr:cytochrome P450 [Streptomyces sp. RerS4]UQX05374.1 cytochrome P450 [Streptomyces sp. RerS4]
MTTIDLLSEAFQAHPHPAYALLRQDGAVHRTAGPMGLETWLITHYDVARDVLADNRFSKDPTLAPDWLRSMGAGGDEGPLGANMLNSDPPDHTRLRRLVGKAFTPRRIERMRPRIQEITDELLESLAAARRPDIVAHLAFPLAMTVICELLGVPPADRRAFGTWTDMALAPPVDEEAVLRRKQGNAAMESYLTALIAELRARIDPGLPVDAQPDLLSVLVAAADGRDALSERELIGMAKLLIVAGHNNAANMVGNGVLSLLRAPDQLALLRARPDLLPSAVEELLRYDGPIERATWRFTTADTEVAGSVIPAGSVVAVVLAAADRDPARFPEPDRLDITRADQEHLAFGHGIHYCLGAALARAEGEIAFGSLLRRFPVLALDCPPEELRWRIGGPSITRGVAALPVTFRAQAPSTSGDAPAEGARQR